MEVILKIKIPESWVDNISHKYVAPIKFLDSMPFGEAGGWGLIEINATYKEIDEIIEDIKRQKHICKVDISPC